MNFASLSIVSFSARGSATMEKIAKALPEFISEGGEFSAETFECFGEKHRTLGEFTERAFSKKRTAVRLSFLSAPSGLPSAQSPHS